ncbi:hypothetical protein AVEN_141682-1 [Araneus ventricosus]|uniref:Uncharacterized protein n=1 Tax=Araneus ventricosus TaxID=182803 RepID=A0A4Y2R554_ARAVE|nr:hypothetical protein AVEN_141682-1 [Araneus ventricosus]
MFAISDECIATADTSKAFHSLHRQTLYFGTLEGKSDKNLSKSPKWLVVVGIPSGLKSERKIRGTLKEASEKNNALRRLKPRFEVSISLNLLTGENRRAINKQL